MFAVHLKRTLNCLQAVVPVMIERRAGRIINVTSVAGVLGTIGQINYSAAKAGIVGITMSAARELAQYGITVNAIAPGAATPLTETIRTDDHFRDKHLARISLDRLQSPLRSHRYSCSLHRMSQATSPARCSPPTAG